MAIPVTRTEFKDFCLRKLGQGILQINLTPEQIDDAIDTGLRFWREYHYDGQIRKFYSLTVTEQNMTDGFFTIPEEVQHIVRVLRGNGLGAQSLNNYFFDPIFNLAASDLAKLAGQGVGQFVATLTNIANITDILSIQPSFEFRRHTDKLYVKSSLGQRYGVGDSIGFEAICWLEPSDFPDIWGERVLGNYCAALMRRQWGENLTKWNGVAMAGGITLNGEEILQRGQNEIDKIEADFQIRYETPPIPFIG